MSIVAIIAVFDAIAPLSTAELTILLVLANYADAHGGSCFPSQESIWQKSRFKSRRGVQKILRRLETRGLVSVPERGRPHHAAHYQLEFAALSVGEPGSPLKLFKTAPKGERRNTPKANQKASKGARRSPDPLDPSLIHKKPAAPVCSRTDEPDAESQSWPPFRVYAAIASRALQDLARERIDPADIGAASARFKELCVQQRLPYDANITQRAVDAAMASLRKKEKAFTNLMATGAIAIANGARRNR